MIIQALKNVSELVREHGLIFHYYNISYVVAAYLTWSDMFCCMPMF